MHLYDLAHIFGEAYQKPDGAWGRVCERVVGGVFLAQVSLQEQSMPLLSFFLT